MLTIARASHERERDVIGVLLDGPLEIDDVFVRERRDRQSDAGQIDSFALAQQTAVDNSANHVGISCAFDDERERAIVEQHSCAWLNHTRKIRVVG